LNIALLTPYTGTNLGDAAIQDAVIENIKRYCPAAVICMISIRPDATVKLHNVPSFPITPFGISHYAPRQSKPIEYSPDQCNDALDNSGTLNDIKAFIKSAPLLYEALRFIKALPVRIFNVFAEVNHIIRSYKFLRNTDILIVSGGGQIDDYWGGAWGHPYALLKWGLIARARKAKYVFLSVGTCALESTLSTIFIKRALRLADYRSYRDSKSKEILNHLDFIIDDPIYPDLAFSYTNQQVIRCRSNANEKKVIGISPITYLARCGWFGDDAAAYTGYLSSLIEFISILLRRDYSIILFSTDSPDREVASKIASTLEKLNQTELTDKVKLVHTDTPGKLFDQLCNVSFVVASRLHGILLSNLCCLPVLAISYDRKVDTYMSDSGLNDYLLDIRGVDTQLLLERFELLINRSQAIKSILMENVINNATELKHQYELVLGTKAYA
jgi:polysaccharide pyruvyl transferase WcaK-like protein